MTRIALALVVLASIAHADVSDPPPRTGWNRLGTRIAYGLQPIEGVTMTTMSLAVSIDRPIHRTWRVVGEYEHAWLGPSDDAAYMDVGVAALSDSGHRVHAGVRRRIGEKVWASDLLGFWIDAEAGGGAMIVDRAPASTTWMPHAFAGLRLGMALERMDQLWEYEVVVRGLVTTEGAGGVFGIGLVWGN